MNLPIRRSYVDCAHIDATSSIKKPCYTYLIYAFAFKAAALQCAHWTVDRNIDSTVLDSAHLQAADTPPGRPYAVTVSGHVNGTCRRAFLMYVNPDFPSNSDS